MTESQKADDRMREALRSEKWIQVKDAIINVKYIRSITLLSNSEVEIKTDLGTSYLAKIPWSSVLEMTQAGWVDLSAGLMTDEDKKRNNY